MASKAAARRDNIMFGSAKVRLCKVIRDIAKAKRGRSMCNKARALRDNVPLRHGQDRNAKVKYSQAETSEGIARNSSGGARRDVAAPGCCTEQICEGGAGRDVAA